MIDSPLSVKVEDDELVIRIGVDTLAWAGERCPDLEDERYEPMFRIVNATEFANDVLHELKKEEEDGTTLVHLMLDKAIVSAIEQGSAAVIEQPKLIK
jgi:hypothetical protein